MCPRSLPFWWHGKGKAKLVLRIFDNKEMGMVMSNLVQQKKGNVDASACSSR